MCKFAHANIFRPAMRLFVASINHVLMNFVKYISTFFRSVLRPLEANFTFFVSMYVLGLICSVITIAPPISKHFYGPTFLEWFLDLYIVCALLSLIPRRFRRYVRLVLYFVLYATALVDAFCFVKFQSTLNPTMLLLIDETNAREAGEFLESYLNADVIFSPIGWVLLLLVVQVVAQVVYVRWGKFHHVVSRLKAFAYHYRRERAWLGALAVVLLVWSVVVSGKNKSATARLMTLPTIGDIEHEMTRIHDCATLYMPVYRLAFSFYANSLASQEIEKLIRAKDNIVVDSCSYTSPTIVLIIGESYNRYHSQLYGYDKKTTPRQMRLARSGRLVKFTDVVSPWNLTSYVFKYMFSTHVVGEKGEWCDYPLFPELFRKAGYHVTFITNQFLPQAAEHVYDFSGGFFLNNPELSRAQFDTRNAALHKYDDGVLADYDKLKSQNTRHNLIIFHLMGQHVMYNTRYPADRAKFTGDDYNRPDLSPKQRNTLAAYDNAVAYNDSIVDQIVERFADKNAIVIYVPDHGEECYNNGSNFYGRMHSANIDARLAREEFDIPFWIWCSHSYAVSHPHLYSRIIRSKRRPFMTDALPHLLLGLAGIHTPNYHAAYDVLSDEYDEHRPRLLKGVTDYNKLSKEK